MKRVSTGRVFIPKFYDNREADLDDQVSVNMKIATIKEKAEFSKMVYKKGGKTELNNREYTALRKKVEKINNYFDENGSPIDTAEKLIADMEEGEAYSIELCSELWNHIMGYDTVFEDSDSEEFTEGED